MQIFIELGVAETFVWKSLVSVFLETEEGIAKGVSVLEIFEFGSFLLNFCFNVP